MIVDMVSIPHLLKLIAIASQLTGYPMPDPGVHPPVKEVDSKQMAWLACPDEKGCDTVGLFKAGTVYIDTQWINGPDNTEHWSEDSFLVHELVHWLQMRNGQKYECPHSDVMEMEAYRTMNEYEQLYENRPGTHNVHGHECDGVVWFVIIKPE